MAFTEKLILPCVLRIRHNETLLENERCLIRDSERAMSFAAEFNTRFKLRASQAIPDPVAGGRRIYFVDGKPVERVCAGCGKWDTDGAKLSRCARCATVMYCSRECQAKDWKEHRKVCK